MYINFKNKTMITASDEHRYLIDNLKEEGYKNIPIKPINELIKAILISYQKLLNQNENRKK